jgi:hypothetical protein
MAEGALENSIDQWRYDRPFKHDDEGTDENYCKHQWRQPKTLALLHHSYHF